MAMMAATLISSLPPPLLLPLVSAALAPSGGFLRARSGAFAFAPRPRPRTRTSPSSTGAASALGFALDDDAGDPPPPTVLCVGETLWDSLPSGMYLGGAPSNVAVHLASLFAASSSAAADDVSAPTVAVAACLGNDQLGREAKRRLALRGVRSDYLQFHEMWETGMAITVLDENGDATPEFNTPAAWDGLRTDEGISELTREQSTKVFVMGTIAARLKDDHGATSAETLSRVRNGAREGTVVLDVNLRSPWYTPGSVLELARGGGDKKLALLKLNEDELSVLEGWCGLESFEGDDGLTGSTLQRRMEQLAISLNSERVCVTRGKDGAALLCTSSDSGGNENLFSENPGCVLDSAEDNGADTVGAGDAFLAALVNSLFVLEEDPERALERACALGGYVAGCRGATPEHGDAPEGLRQVFSPSAIL